MPIQLINEEINMKPTELLAQPRKQKTKIDNNSVEPRKVKLKGKK